MREVLREARKAAGMTRHAVAERLGISPRYYSMIEAGDRTGDFEIWDALEEMFHIHQTRLRKLSDVGAPGQPVEADVQ